MAEPIVITESLGGSPLSRAARAGQLPQWYRPAPRGGDWSAYVDEVRRSVAPTWFDELAPAFSVKGAAADRLQRSAGGKGIVITTGQQPGLFGGPLMSFNKALAARALADVLQETTGIPVAPVFWAATDDADFDEASVIDVALDGGERELRLSRRPPAGTPMSLAAMSGAELEALARVFQEACASTPHAWYLEETLAAYRDGVTVGDAYVAVLRAVLEPLGIAVLDASHPAVPAAGAPLLRRVAREGGALASAIAERNEAIRAAGFEPQVDEVADLSLVFANANGTKRRLTLREATAFTGAEDDFYLSPTVLVRPVLERVLLPTAAYLGGPGEVAYFAQISAVAETLGVPLPLVLPRWSATVLEPRVRRIINDLGVEAAALANPHAIEGRVARQLVPSEAQRALDALRATIATESAVFRRAAEHLVPGPAVDGPQREIEHRIARMERRLVAAVKRRETEAMRKIATARGSLYPHGIRQERKLSFITFLARYGPALVEAMLAGARTHARALVAGAPALTPPSAPAPAPV